MKTREQFKRFTAPTDSGMIHFLSDSHGVYIPKVWMDMIDPEYWDELTPWGKEVISAGPEHNDYWNAWDQLLDSQFLIDDQDREWTLYQDGDLWLICEDAMTDEEKTNFGFDQD